jgi:AraC-like DNA-binding protein
MAPVFLKVIAASGGDASAVARSHGLPDDAAERREVDVSVDALVAISDEAAAQARDPDLGLHLATRLPHGAYGLLEYIGRSASSVRQAGERFLRYSSLLLNDLVTFSFEQRGTAAVLTQRIEGYPPCVGRHAGEMFIALVVRYMREITGRDVTPIRVAFAHTKPRDTSELDAFFRAPIAWDNGENRVELPASLLDEPIVSRDPMLFSVLEEQAEKLAASRDTMGPKKKDELEPVREKIRAALADGNPDLANIARALGTSARTLQRRLGDEGTTFQAVVDGVREELARRYMMEERFTLGDVAYLLGFSEISAFTRAFKRWTGMTPSRWRDRSKPLA